MKKIFIGTVLILSTLFGSFIEVDAAYLNEVDSFNNIVIFIKFSDEETYTAPYGYQYYVDMFNGVDQLSLRDYYLEATYNQLEINSYIPDNNGQIIYYTDIYPRSNFEPYDSVTNPSGYRENEWDSVEHGLLKRAIDYVDQNNLIPDTMDLDVNNDGEMDSITFMVSGEDSGWNTLLWPHKWELSTYYDYNYGFTGSAPSINGVSPLTYTFELLGDDIYYDYIVNVGVLAHETFHLLSAPDLYHYYSYLDVTPVGDWGLMESNGDIPSHMLGYMKYRYGTWIDQVTELNETGTYTLYPLQDNPNNIYKVYTGFENEWIYLEYRDQDGLYESNLPDTGLLVYRVNPDIDGNDAGSYDDLGNSTDEVWIYRPGMDDVILPIILEDNGSVIDGYIDDATLSQSNMRDSMGLGTDIIMFNSIGEEIPIGIYNVMEHNGYITFDLFLEASILLDTNGVDLGFNEVTLYDNHLMDYHVSIINVPDNLDAYYTIDGTTPTMSSTAYTGAPISINALNNQVKVALYNGTNLVSTLEESYTFSSTIESDHYPYGDMTTTYWYFDFDEATTYYLEFDGNSYLEEDFDYVRIFDALEEFNFTGDQLDTFEHIFINDYLFIELMTDEALSDYYGFLALITPVADISLNITGSNVINHDVFSDYIDLGYTLDGYDKNLYHVEVENTVNEDVVGEYVVTYNVLNALNEIVITKTRTVYVIDDIAPTVTLLGAPDLFIEAGSEFVDPYIEVSDNYDSELTIEVDGFIDTSKLDIEVFIYTVTDSSGNQTIVTRRVEVVDTVAPTLTLNPGIDTIYVGGFWADTGVTITDNLGINFDISMPSIYDLSVPGIYEYEYLVEDSSGNIGRIIRYITVLEAKEHELEIECSSFVSTIELGDDLNFPSCTLKGIDESLYESVGWYVDGVLTSSFKPTNNGNKTINYHITYEGVEYVKTLEYMVIQYTTDYNEVLYIERRRDYL